MCIRDRMKGTGTLRAVASSTSDLVESTFAAFEEAYVLRNETSPPL